MRPILALSLLAILPFALSANASLIDFNAGPFHTALPLDLTADAITAHCSGGYFIDDFTYIGVTPTGFGGYCLSPTSVYGSDLVITFSQPISDFSIIFAPHELACDSTATIRGTAYMDSANVGFHDAQAPNPGTWPSGTLTLDGTQTNNMSFNKVVVHYQSPPPTGGDYGVIFVADNLTFTAAPIPEPASLALFASALPLLLRRRKR